MLKTLALSLRIGECIYGEKPGTCPVVWDGTDGCCGEDIEFTFRMSVQCRSTFPYISMPVLLPIYLSRLVVREKILGIFEVEVADITQDVENQLSEAARGFLAPQNKWIYWTNGEFLNLVDFLNLLLSINAPAGLRCPGVE